MRTIHKFPFKVEDTVTLELPRGAVIIRVADSGQIAHHGLLWAIVDTDQPMERRAIYVRGTGHPLPAERTRYIGTFDDGPFVWHVLEPIRPVHRTLET